MNFIESFKQALDSLRQNKLRSFLTMLGIIMGVFSVITIVAIGNAAQSYIDAQFAKIGANTITVRAKGKDLTQSDLLNFKDLEVIKKVVPQIKNIGGMTQAFGQLRANDKQRDSNIIGAMSEYKGFYPIEMAAGRFISEADVSEEMNSVVIKESYAKQVFKRVDVVGETIRMTIYKGQSVNLRVVGVLKSEGGLMDSFDSEEFPTTIIMPITTVNSLLGRNDIDSIDIAVVCEKDKLREMGDKVIRVLEFTHNNKNKYSAENSADLQKTISNVTGVISIVLLVIAIITLVVGGIGIVNILLVSVTERIREIGIRKAIGANKRDILMQFITESIMMTGISGLIGIIMGVAAGGIAAALIKIPPVVDFKIIFMSFSGSVLLGLIFGVYPAKKAADLDPIEALRYE